MFIDITYGNRNNIVNDKITMNVTERFCVMSDNARMKDKRINEWIFERLRDLGKRQVDLADALDVPAPRISELLKGKWTLDVTQLMTFARMLQITPAQAIEGLATHTLPATPDLPGEIEGYTAIKRYNYKASAGEGWEISNDTAIEKGVLFQSDWISNITDAPLDKLFTLTVDGESMAPTLHNGDLILIDCTRQNPASEGMFLINRDGDLIVKRLYKSLADGSLNIYSDNPSYASESNVPPGEIDVIGRVMWIGRKT